MKYQYCPKCSGHLENRYIEQEKHQRRICQSCGYIFYRNPKPTAAVVLFRDGKIVLVKRKYKPLRGYWSLPAGFAEYDETIQQTAIREVKEETNLDIRIKRLLDVHSSFENPNKHVLIVGFEGEIIGGQLKAGDDAEQVNFFDPDHLPDEIAWHCHLHFIHKALGEMNK